MVIVKVQVLIACVAGAKRGGGGGGGREKSTKEGNGEGSACYKSRVFAFNPPFSELTR